jgi:hypothetical protein
MPEDVAYRQWRGENRREGIEREPSILLNKMWPKADLRQPLLPPYTCTRIIYY